MSEAGQRLTSFVNFVKCCWFKGKLNQLFNEESVIKRLRLAILLGISIKCAF